MKLILRFFPILTIWLGVTAATVADEVASRQVLSLDGVWSIAEGKMDAPPSTFNRTVPVPGLVTLATPAFTPMPGPKVADRRAFPQKDPARDAFWYRRTFRFDQPVPAVARLKVAKAMFGSQVILNGRLLGDHAGSFTPAYYDARAALQPGENVLLIRVGADRDAVTQAVPGGFDNEKDRYIPGIFDSVELILSGTPHFLRVQTVPEIATQTVRVQAVLRNAGPARSAAVTFVVREVKSGRIAGQVTSEPVALAADTEATMDVRIPLADCRLWSPEDPFLYRLEADTGADRFTTRFGMREFRFDPVTRRAVLNGQPYFMRGSNFTLYRFFEDDDCRLLPWTDSWVRLLHQRVKEMRWNSLRYCIGFPPEAWYDIADELGILIQDEFPLWKLSGVKRGELEKEYAEWIHERSNHPSVVIWDAQNETVTPETGAALTAVRSLDLSGRPWDNGWSAPQAPGDALEQHIYHFSPWQSFDRFTLSDLTRANRVPRSNDHKAHDGHNAVIINEYAWLWLNRDGSPTTLTRNFYDNALGENATVAQRRHLYATHFAAETEFWRSYRHVAALLHFCSLGYSRADGQTSDNWADVTKLTWEPEFHRHVRDAFAPVGLMIEFWSERVLAGQAARLPVRLINDLAQAWAGEIHLRLRRADTGSVVREFGQPGRMEPQGSATLSFELAWPQEPGAYVLEAELRGDDGEPVRSQREFTVETRAEQGLAFGRPATASTGPAQPDGPTDATDGDPATVWQATGPQAWLAVDLGSARSIRRVRIEWGFLYAVGFAVQLSADGQTWSEVHLEKVGRGGASEIGFATRAARFVRVQCQQRCLTPTQIPSPGYAIRELQVFD
ncbi:MAG: discoidin domain-containing protein [Opitutaceae bacterium]|nr:discoidin domain-containing protein [Opitutaceae bacterium]